MIIQLDEAKRTLVALDADVKELGNALKIESLKEKLAELEDRSSSPEFWSDQAKSGKILQEIKRLRDTIEEYDQLVKKHNDTLELCEIAIEEKIQF